MGESYYGLLLILLIVFYHLYRAVHRKAEIVLLFLVVLIGPFSDFLYKYFGLLQYHNPQHSLSWLPPLWIFFLWGLFSVNISLFSWLKKRWILSTLLGAIGGPASYLSAIRLGGATLLTSTPEAIMTIGGMWAVLLPGFIWLSDYFDKRFKEP
jgi:hypothetical protein